MFVFGFSFNNLNDFYLDYINNKLNFCIPCLDLLMCSYNFHLSPNLSTYVEMLIVTRMSAPIFIYLFVYVDFGYKLYKPKYKKKKKKKQKYNHQGNQGKVK